MMTKKLVLVLIVMAGCLALLAPQRSVESASSAVTATSAAATTVVISNFKFQPQDITVRVGAVVTWMDKEGSHTVTSDNSIFESGGLIAGKTFSHKFMKPGTYKYHCSIHGPDMSGTVTVKR